jgi:ribosome maturation factor RimP
MIEKVKTACRPAIESLGYDMADVTYGEEFGVMELCIYIRNKNGKPISHKDCEKVSIAVDGIIEELDPTDGKSFNLSVSSLGIE